MLPETKYQKFRKSQQKPWERFAEITQGFSEITQSSDDLYETLNVALNVKTGPSSEHLMYADDRVMMTITSRAMENIDAFVSAAATWNMSAASTLVRLQLDNLMTINLLDVSPNPNHVVDHILSGKKLSSLRLPAELIDMVPKGRRAGRMYHKEWVLQILAAARFPWLPDSYASTSGYVHFSSEHESHIFKISGARIEGRVPADIDQYNKQDIGDLVKAILQPSQALVEMMNEWATIRKER